MVASRARQGRIDCGRMSNGCCGGNTDGSRSQDQRNGVCPNAPYYCIPVVTGCDSSEVQPAFYHAYEYQRGQKLGVIRLNPVVADRLAIDGVGDTLHPRHLPMLVQPAPWLDYNRGGYLHNHSASNRLPATMYTVLTALQRMPCASKIQWSKSTT